ncbi:PH domain-containing protein [Actinoplanes missouriensis]|uniref:PH domain-containing protein n=1 Tax=Actinoplanes missouriensis TaxID=1866 RepID=UPI0033D98645
MIRRLSAYVTRRRHPILVVTATLVTGAVLARALGADPDLLAPWLVLLFLTADLLYLVTLVAPSTRRPATAFDVDGGALHTPRTGGLPLVGVAHLALLGLLALNPAGTTPMGIPIPLAVVALLAALALYPRGLWYGVRLTLTPEGLRNEKYAGTVVIPWQAIAGIHLTDSTRARVRLRLADPDQVTVRGWTTSRRTLEFDGVEPSVVAGTISRYLNAPGERPHIGAGAADPVPGASAGTGTGPG